MVSPISCLAKESASKLPTPSTPTCAVISATHCSAGFCQLPFFTNAAVGVLLLFSATRVRPARMRRVVSLEALTMGSQPMIRSAAAMLTRVVRISSCVLATRTWLQVAPPFCANPAESCVTMPLPSMCAAMPSNWPMVITPVPPTPATTMPQGCVMTGSSGSGNAPRLSGRHAAVLDDDFFLKVPPSTVTKLGQKPLRQLVSLLHVLWLMVRLRPSSVSRGSTDKQLDCTPQSPQPSHTSSLIITRTAGSTMVPRLRRRRFSVAQVWS